MDIHSMFRQENRRKLQVIFNTLINFYDSRALKHDRLTELLIGAVATHKASLLMCNHSSLMMAIRSLLTIQHRRFSNLCSKPLQEISNEEVSVELKQTSVSYL